MKKRSSVSKQSESSRKVERRDSREVMSELVAQLQKQLDRKQEPGQSAEVPAAESPNLDQMTVGVDHFPMARGLAALASLSLPS